MCREIWYNEAPTSPITFNRQFWDTRVLLPYHPSSRRGHQEKDWMYRCHISSSMNLNDNWVVYSYYQWPCITLALTHQVSRQVSWTHMVINNKYNGRRGINIKNASICHLCSLIRCIFIVIIIKVRCFKPRQCIL